MSMTVNSSVPVVGCEGVRVRRCERVEDNC